MASVIGMVEQAFIDLSHGKANMPPKAYLVVDQGDFRAMPAAVAGAAGIKWVNMHPQNTSHDLPSVMALLVYNDPLTGYPLAVMDATDITAYRTGATAAIASKRLARKTSQTLGLVGAGQQSYTQLLAHVELFDFKLIKVFDILSVAVDRFIESFPKYPVQAASLQDVLACDIVCTMTPSHEPFVIREWVMPGTHINAIGADAKGKEELEPSILCEATVVVDSLEQAIGSGEVNVPITEGLFTAGEIYATLDEIVAGKKQGRKDDREITVFDSTGIAIEDIAVAKSVYDKAKAAGHYLSLDFVEE